MTVFDDVRRTSEASPHQDEPRFPYLNASARPEAAQVRALVETWFARYPETHRAALIGRFRSSMDNDHHSAFFELFLHELLVSRGHRLIEIEPDVPNSTRKPDYLFESNSGAPFYVEATLATGQSQTEAGATKRLNTALRAIDTFSSPGHFLDLHLRGKPEQPISLKSLKAALRVWVDGLAPGERSVAPFIYSEFGLRIMLNAHPKHTAKETRSIGVRHFGASGVSVDHDLRAAIEKKAKRYGELPHPFLVAVNSLGFFQEEDQVLDAVLGTERTVSVQRMDGTHEVRNERQHDGVWLGPAGPRKQMLSAVLATREVTPWNFSSRVGHLVRNAYATRPLPPLALGFAEINPVDGVWTKTEGQTNGEILGLPRNWPQ